jgi:drug/metabolite transporter (DMT)-like permease
LGGHERGPALLRPLCLHQLALSAGAAALLPVLLWWRKPLKPGSWRGALITGLLQMTGSLALGVWALSQGSAGRTAVLVYTMPVWLVMLSWLAFGERLRGFQWLAVALALAGLFLVIRPSSLPHDIFSIILALGGGLLWALSGAWVKILPREQISDFITFNAWQLFLGGVPLLLIALFLEPGWPDWTPVFIAALSYNVIPATALGYVLWFYALKGLPGSIAGLSTLIIPVLGVVAAWLQLSEVPGAWEGGGIILIISGLATLTIAGLREGGEAQERAQET